MWEVFFSFLSFLTKRTSPHKLPDINIKVALSGVWQVGVKQGMIRVKKIHKNLSKSNVKFNISYSSM